MASFTRSRTAALISLSVIATLALGLGLGLGIGLQMSPSTLCNALAGTIADRLDQGLLEDKETFEAVLDTAGLPGLEVVKASPASVEKAACEQASPALAVNVVFSLGGALEETLYSTAGKDQLCMAIASVAGVGKEHIEVSVTAGSAVVNTFVKAKLNYFTSYLRSRRPAPCDVDFACATRLRFVHTY